MYSRDPLSLIIYSFIDLFDFTLSNGWYPIGSLISDGTFLYGMTNIGGAGGNCQNNLGGSGVIFKIKPDGTNFIKLLDLGWPVGGLPYGSLICDGTFLYGLASCGGVNDSGTVFKLRTDGTNDTVLFSFDGAINGKAPHGSFLPPQ